MSRVGLPANLGLTVIVLLVNGVVLVLKEIALRVIVRKETVLRGSGVVLALRVDRGLLAGRQGPMAIVLLINGEIVRRRVIVLPKASGMVLVPVERRVVLEDLLVLMVIVLKVKVTREIITVLGPVVPEGQAMVLGPAVLEVQAMALVPAVLGVQAMALGPAVPAMVLGPAALVMVLGPAVAPAALLLLT